MTTIDQIRELAFYLLRKLNDFLVTLTTETPPPHQPPVNQPTDEDINTEIDRLHMVFGHDPDDIERRLREIRRRQNEEQPTLRSPPTTTEVTRDEQDDDIDRRLREIRRRLDEEDEELRQIEEPQPTLRQPLTIEQAEKRVNRELDEYVN